MLPDPFFALVLGDWVMTLGDALVAECEILEIWETTQVQSGPKWESRFTRNNLSTRRPFPILISTPYPPTRTLSRICDQW